MRISLSHRQGRLSPVFDTADGLLLIDTENRVEQCREDRVLTCAEPLRRAREVLGWGVDILICGAISMMQETALDRAGVRVIGFVRGDVEEVLGAYLSGNLFIPRFLMPGRSSRPRRAGMFGKKDAPNP
jgi:predicted Fe-Mo cluster-binding NifX family protein